MGSTVRWRVQRSWSRDVVMDVRRGFGLEARAVW